MQNPIRAWMLPEAVVEYLPAQAALLNRLEQTALAVFNSWGYELLRPPMIEYMDTFSDVNPQGGLIEQTIQFKDQKTGKQLAIRADVTPQIARIDAHYLRTNHIARYAYMGEVVKSLPTGHGRHRNPSVVGAELFGSDSLEADSEIISLMINYLQRIELPSFTVSLGNVDIAVELLKALDVPEHLYHAFFQAWSRKDKETLSQLSKTCQIDEVSEQGIYTIVDAYGSPELLTEMANYFSAYEQVQHEIEKLQRLSEMLVLRYPHLALHVDLSDVHGYGYHNGIIFAAYVDGLWQSVARGGRYNGVSDGFVVDASRARPATGFSCNLNLLTEVVSQQAQPARLILCALPDTPALDAFISELRQADIVIKQFDDKIPVNRDCSHQIVSDGDQFAVVDI